jgi:hypothetical protein
MPMVPLVRPPRLTSVPVRSNRTVSPLYLTRTRSCPSSLSLSFSRSGESHHRRHCLAVLAISAFTPPLKRLRSYALPSYPHIPLDCVLLGWHRYLSGSRVLVFVAFLDPGDLTGVPLDVVLIRGDVVLHAWLGASRDTL